MHPHSRTVSCLLFRGIDRNDALRPVGPVKYVLWKQDLLTGKPWTHTDDKIPHNPGTVIEV